MKALIAAGGRGTRLRPITYTNNKHLIPIANKPMLFYAIEAVAAAGITEIGLVFGPESHKAISAAIAPLATQGLRFTLMIQDAPLGLAHVVRLAETFVAGDDFVFYLGDNLMTHDVRRCVDQFRSQHLNCLLVLAQVKEPQRFGVAEIQAGRIVSVEEKPLQPKSSYAVAGLYIYDRSIFEAVSRLRPSARGELEISDAHQYLLDHGFRVGYTEIDGWWKDTGKPEDLLEANRMVLEQMSAARMMRHEGTVDGASTIEGNVTIEAGARVVASRIRGPSIIGKNSVVERSYIGPFTAIGPDCGIVNSEIEYSILLDGCRVNDAEIRIERSLLGRGVEIIKGQHRPRIQRLIVGDQSRIELP
ncbi:MAG TPA: glucose-1-phosphate thymidylyltransferase [Nitrospiria bacterium]|nr:glucose-1-phosphate thymidylyltransferase [Nitrospiria bacterium]